MQNTDEPRVRKRFFTVDEANRMLPLVRSIASDIVVKFQDLSELRERVEFMRNSRREGMTAAHREEVEQMEVELETVKNDLYVLVQELQNLGVELKGPDGLVDFPAMLDDREVCLCWKLGEPEVLHWHERDAGFAGRQRLTAQLPIGRGSN